MLKKLLEKFKNGIRKIKWFSSLFSERLKIEIAVIKLFHQSDEISTRKEELLKTIGQRVVELKGHAEKSIIKDRVIIEATGEIKKLEKNIDELKQKASEISRVVS